MFELIDRQSLKLLFLICQAEEFVDVTTRTDNLDVIVTGSNLRHLRLECHQVLLLHLTFQQANSTDIKRLTKDTLTIADETYLCGATTDIHIKKRALRRQISKVVVVDDSRLLITRDDLQFDMCLVLDSFHEGLSILGITHSRCCTRTIFTHMIDLHQLLVSLHRGEELHAANLGDAAVTKHIHTQSQRNTQEKKFIQ